MSNSFFAIYHVIEELSFDKYGLKREAKKKELICISSKEVCEEKLEGYENKIEVKGTVVVADYWYCNPVKIEETDPNVLRKNEAFKKITPELDPLLEDIFGFGKSESAADTLKKQQNLLTRQKSFLLRKESSDK